MSSNNSLYFKILLYSYSLYHIASVIIIPGGVLPTLPILTCLQLPKSETAGKDFHPRCDYTVILENCALRWSLKVCLRRRMSIFKLP